MQQLELKVPPLALWTVFATSIFALSQLVPEANLAFPGRQLVAAAAFAAGAVIALAGVVQFWWAKTTVNPLAPNRASSVVASGVYRVSRNPMYVGMAAALFAVAAWTTTLFGYALVVAFCMYMTRFQIKPEERALQASFGEQYTSYMQQVRRWL